MQEMKTDKEQREENSNDKTQESSLKEEIKNIKEELDKFKDGTMSDEFILDALFEMTSKISGFYVPNIEDYIKKETGKKLEDLNESEQKEWLQRFNDSRPIRRDLMRVARQVHIQNMEWLAKALTEYNEEYF
jgi:flagellin-like hook-associated protein FlgL